VERVIDIHVHPVSRDLVRDPRNLRLMERHAACLAPGNAVEVLLRRMDAGGIAISCLMGPTPGDGIALTNEMVRDAVGRKPDRLIGFAGVDPVRDGKEATRTVIGRAVKEWGFRGVGEFGGVDLLDPRCDAVYETCIELDVPLLVHAGVSLPSMLLKHGHPFALDEVANRYPGLKLIAAHAGVPWLAETIAVAVRHPNVFLDVSALPAFDPRAVTMVLAWCLREDLAERLLFGSDFPVVDPASYAEGLRKFRPGWFLRRLLRAPKFSAEMRAAMLGGNAARLLKMET